LEGKKRGRSVSRNPPQFPLKSTLTVAATVPETGTFTAIVALAGLIIAGWYLVAHGRAGPFGGSLAGSPYDSFSNAGRSDLSHS
jgi:hypothetical protein